MRIIKIKTQESNLISRPLRASVSCTRRDSVGFWGREERPSFRTCLDTLMFYAGHLQVWHPPPPPIRGEVGFSQHTENWAKRVALHPFASTRLSMCLLRRRPGPLHQEEPQRGEPHLPTRLQPCAPAQRVRHFIWKKTDLAQWLVFILILLEILHQEEKKTHFLFWFVKHLMYLWEKIISPFAKPQIEVWNLACCEDLRSVFTAAVELIPARAQEANYRTTRRGSERS